MSELPPEARRILDQARDGDDPRPQDRMRVRRALAGALAAPASTVGSAARANTGGSGATSSSGIAPGLLGKVIAGTMLAGLAGLGTWNVSAGTPPPPAVAVLAVSADVDGVPPVPPSVPRMHAGAPEQTAEPRAAPERAPRPTPASHRKGHRRSERAADDRAPAETPSARESSSHAMRSPGKRLIGSTRSERPSVPNTATGATSTSSTTAPTDGTSASSTTGERSSLARELKLIENASEALRDGHLRDALTLLERHATHYPDGRLVQERRGLRAIAWCRQGRMKRAADARRRLLDDAPRSPLAKRVRAACSVGVHGR